MMCLYTGFLALPFILTILFLIYITNLFKKIEIIMTALNQKLVLKSSIKSKKGSRSIWFHSFTSSYSNVTTVWNSRPRSSAYYILVNVAILALSYIKKTFSSKKGYKEQSYYSKHSNVPISVVISFSRATRSMLSSKEITHQTIIPPPSNCHFKPF